MCDAMALQLIYAAIQLCTGVCASLAAASQKLYRTMTTQLHRAFYTHSGCCCTFLYGIVFINLLI